MLNLCSMSAENHIQSDQHITSIYALLLLFYSLSLGSAKWSLKHQKK